MASKNMFENVKDYINNETEFILDQDYYVNEKTKLKLKCKKCGKKYNRTLNSIQASNKNEHYTKCKKCREYDDFYNRIREYFKEFGDGCILVEKEYRDLNNDELEIICPICGEHFFNYYKAFKVKSSKMCNSCYHRIRGENRKYTIEQVKEIIKSVNNNKLISEEYLDYNNPLDILCACGEKFSVSLRYYQKGKNTCDKCSNRGIQWNKELVKEYIFSKESEYIEQEYINVDALMKFKCQKCGDVYESSFYSFYKNEKYLCNDCSFEISGEKQRYSYEEIYNKIEETGCHLITDYYTGNTQVLEIECGTCHETFFTSWQIFNNKNNKACPDCNGKISAGENKFIELLENYNINYIFQHKYNDCKFKNVLKFDFFLPDYGIIIEVDGLGHFKALECFGGEEEFKLAKIRDGIKNTYCKNNKIPLIRIPYNSNNMNNFISRSEIVINHILSGRFEELIKIKLKTQSVA